MHLLVPGTSLPARRKGDKVVIDWVQAAESQRGRPTGFDFDANPPGAEAAMDESDLDMAEFMKDFEKWQPPKSP